MNIIVVRDARSKPLRLYCDPRRMALLASLCLGVLMLLAAAAGFLAGDRLGPAHAEARQQLDRTAAELAAQSERLGAIERQSERQLDAMALRLGELQARSARLEALGERLTQLGKLEDGEFSFGEPPALGGPVLAEARELERIDIDAELLGLERQLERQRQELSVLERLIADRELDEDLRPAGRPVASGWLSSRYGRRVDPFSGEPDFHPGVDFSGRPGDDILAVAAGVVVKSAVHPQYGNVVDVDHGNGYLTRYAHNQENLVAVGERVRAGQPIARMGASGRATGTHVHFEVWHRGRRMDPMELVADIRG